LRKDTKKLGRVAEMQQKDKDIKIAKKSMQEDVVAEGMVREEKKGKARGKRGREEVEDGEEEGVGSQSGVGAKRKKKKVGKGRSAVKSEGGEDEEADEDGGDE